jgi:hypothetical protein
MKDHKLKEAEVDGVEVNKLDVNDQEVEQALKNFRASVHAWSEAEFTRSRAVRAPQSSLWRWLAAPAVSWGAAAVLAFTAIGVPVVVHHEHQVQILARQHADEQQRLRDAQEKAATQMATIQMAAMDDDKLLQHVDEDIRQSTPDAMEPLASLMSTSGQE